ncbi:MerR family transcriptional regulator [Bacillus sp. HMF5848]|uniref:MerR family transcriptional regulator n=1 Tax=Bacillus sp. HMF5848 TaxID=2495421 RepID=UPI000F7A3AE3|nr:MerR family transcriptional regulator [Bacillus sp. HMF5848]RSK27460.1 MerR family transcriptional regulator [Bacillus sp. HMF5848]
MASHEGKYNIKAISKILGIQPGTLRAWERRYKMIAPVRNDSGHRLYSDEHLKILKWLMNKVNNGFTISQAVSLLESSDMKIDTAPTVVESNNHVQENIDDLLQALLAFDEQRGTEVMNRAFSIYSIEKVIIEITGPVLVRIGELWEEGKITSAHEHFASSFIRSRIGSIFHTLPVNGLLPKGVAVCGPNEWHELGLLIFTLYIRRKGFDVVYLGASLAENDLEKVIAEINPKFLFLSVTLPENASKTLQLIDQLQSQNSDLAIGIGGAAFAGATKDSKYEANFLGDTKEDWDNWLKERLK